ncbi:MAG: hypothetical protein IPN98_06790 [Propionivibrio sp.]|nr:hypothetical protein [Propionivibrio sp.]
MQLSLGVLVDVLALTLLMHTGGGLRSGLGVLLLVNLAGAGLVGQGRLVPFTQHWQHSRCSQSNPIGRWCPTLKWSIFFRQVCSVRVSLQLHTFGGCWRSVITNEELACQRGVELKNQTFGRPACH